MPQKKPDYIKVRMQLKEPIPISGGTMRVFDGFISCGEDHEAQYAVMILSPDFTPHRAFVIPWSNISYMEVLDIRVTSVKEATGEGDG